MILKQNRSVAKINPQIVDYKSFILHAVIEKSTNSYIFFSERNRLTLFLDCRYTYNPINFFHSLYTQLIPGSSNSYNSVQINPVINNPSSRAANYTHDAIRYNIRAAITSQFILQTCPPTRRTTIIIFLPAHTHELSSHIFFHYNFTYRLYPKLLSFVTDAQNGNKQHCLVFFITDIFPYIWTLPIHLFYFTIVPPHTYIYNKLTFAVYRALFLQLYSAESVITTNHVRSRDPPATLITSATYVPTLVHSVA